MPADCSRNTNGPARAVHDRHFRRRQVDVGVVDAEARERRHQVLDRQHLAAVAATGRCTSIVSVTSSASAGMSTDRIEVDAAEHDAGIDRGRAQRQIDLLAGVQPDAGGADHVLERALLEHAGSRLVADRAASRRGRIAATAQRRQEVAKVSTAG